MPVFTTNVGFTHTRPNYTVLCSYDTLYTHFIAKVTVSLWLASSLLICVHMYYGPKWPFISLLVVIAMVTSFSSKKCSSTTMYLVFQLNTVNVLDASSTHKSSSTNMTMFNVPVYEAYG